MKTGFAVLGFCPMTTVIDIDNWNGTKLRNCKSCFYKFKGLQSVFFSWNKVCISTTAFFCVFCLQSLIHLQEKKITKKSVDSLNKSLWNYLTNRSHLTKFFIFCISFVIIHLLFYPFCIKVILSQGRWTYFKWWKHTKGEKRNVKTQHGKEKDEEWT